MAKEYWVCIIGPTSRDNLPDGADFPMRRAAQEAFEKVTGHEEETCWSGWGYTPKRVEEILKICAK